MFSINTVGREDLSGKGTIQHLEVLGSWLVYMWGKSLADSRQSMCKGPENRTHLVRLKKSEMVSVAETA